MGHVQFQKTATNITSGIGLAKEAHIFLAPRHKGLHQDIAYWLLTLCIQLFAHIYEVFHSAVTAFQEISESFHIIIGSVKDCPIIV